MEPQDIVKALQKEFPKSALKERKGAQGKSFTYIEGHAVIHRMLDVAPNHEVHIKDHWIDIETSGGREKRIFNILIEVTIPGLGTRPGHGVVTLGGGEDIIKGGLTDAYKNALKYFGVGIGLYGSDYEAPPPPPSSRKLLADALKAKGIDPVTATRERLNKEAKALTDEEVDDWLLELSQPLDKAIPAF